MPIPDFQTLMLPVLKEAANGEVKVSDAIEILAQKFRLSEDQKAEPLPRGKQSVFANRVHWAKTYLAKAGLIDVTRRAHFIISDRGKQALSNNPSKIDIRFLDQFSEFVEFRAKSNKADEILFDDSENKTKTESTPDETMRSAHKEIEEALKQDLLDRILKAPPAFFEQIIVQLLTSMGYGGTVVSPGRVLGQSGDGGVDGVIDQDALGLDRVYVQAKRYQPENRIGPSVIREFFGSLDRFKAAKGVLVTTSSFTRDAEDTAGYMSKRIVLIDGDRLAGLMIRYNVGRLIPLSPGPHHVVTGDPKLRRT